MQTSVSRIPALTSTSDRRPAPCGATWIRRYVRRRHTNHGVLRRRHRGAVAAAAAAPPRMTSTTWSIGDVCASDPCLKITRCTPSQRLDAPRSGRDRVTRFETNGSMIDRAEHCRSVGVADGIQAPVYNRQIDAVGADRPQMCAPAAWRAYVTATPGPVFMTNGTEQDTPSR